MRVFRILSLVALAAIMVNCSKTEDLYEEVGVDNSEFKSAVVAKDYIVVLKNEQLSSLGLDNRKAQVNERAQGLIKKHGMNSAVFGHVYGKAIQGFSIKMTAGELRQLETDPDVKYIEEDKIVSIPDYAVKAKPGSSGSNPEAMPWGIARVGGGIAATGVAWIIDTGIDLDHPDLNVDVNRSAVFISGRNVTPDDQNGHGSHVSGTIAAIDNEIGVIGVAAGATVVAVRVLDRRGSGTTSGVIAGVDYVAANGSTGDVANMSLGGGISTALDDAVYAAAQTGVKFVLAAGNESTNANNSSPARVNGPNIYTISAMDSADQFAYFSNYGSPVDYSAPGVSIYSSYSGGGYATLSGTSMAAPHVAGLLLLGAIRTDGFVSGDPDGNPDPIAHH